MASSNIKSVEISVIDVPRRIRTVDQAHVDFFKAAIADQGFKGAITVRPSEDNPSRFELVAGAHRLEAMRQLGEPEIPADIQLMTDDEARLWEINENLVRRELNAKDRAVFLLEAKRLRQRIGGGWHGGDRKAIKVRTSDLDPRPFPTSFTDEMVERLGIKRTMILADIAFAEKLDALTLDMVDGTDLANNRSALIALAGEEEDRRHGIVRDIKAGKFKTVGAAIASRNGRVAPGGDRDVTANDHAIIAFVKAWEKIGDKYQAEAIQVMAQNAERKKGFVKAVRAVLREEM